MNFLSVDLKESQEDINNSIALKNKISQACVYIHKSVISATIRFKEDHRRYYCKYFF
jgi:hypothetical protein